MTLSFSWIKVAGFHDLFAKTFYVEVHILNFSSNVLNQTHNFQTSRYHWHRGVRYHGVIDTAQSDSLVSMTPRSQIPWHHWHRGVRLYGVIDTSESDTMASLTPRSQTPWCHWHRGVRYHANSDFQVSLTPRNQTPWWHWHCVVRLNGIIDTAKSGTMVSLTPFGFMTPRIQTIFTVYYDLWLILKVIISQKGSNWVNIAILELQQSTYKILLPKDKLLTK